MPINPTTLKALIDTQITNETVDFSITPAEVGGRMKDTIDYTTEQIASVATGPQGPQGVQGPAGPIGPVGPAGLEWRGTWASGTSYLADDAVGYNGASYFCILATSGTTAPNLATNNWALLASQGAQGIQGVQGPTGAQGPAGSGASLTNATIPGGTINSPVAITVDVLTTAIVNNSETYYSVPNYTNDQTKIGKKIFIRNNSSYGASIRGEVGVNSTFYTNTTALPNGFEAYESPLLLNSMRTTELTYLGNIGGYERWSSHLAFMPRTVTTGQFGTVSLALINQSNVNSDISVVTPNNATDNYMKLFTGYCGNGDSVIVINGSLTIDIKLLGTPLYYYTLLGLNYNTDPYVIPAGKAARFTKAYSGFYFLAEIISYN